MDRLPNELQFFDPPSVQPTIESSFTLDLSPFGQVVNAEVIEFLLSKSEHYLDLLGVFLYLRCRIRHKGAGKKLGAEVDLTNQKVTETPRSVSEAADPEALKSGAYDDAKARAVDLRKAAQEAQVLAESYQEIKIIDAAPSNAFFTRYLTEWKWRLMACHSKLGMTVTGTKCFSILY